MTHDKIGNGLSGCKLELVSDRVLRKHSSSIQYNNRLSQQINKQSLFSNLILKNISTPKVLNVGTDTLYNFDMEYIPGYSFQEYFSSANLEEINFVTETLISYFDFFLNNAKLYSINSNLISKIESLKANSEFTEFLVFLKEYCETVELKVPKTFCHGDLTFSNIIFHKNRLFFIDFLDSYVDSILCDLVKVKQEIYHNWNLKLLNIESLRIRQTYGYIWKGVEKRYSEIINSQEFEILDVMNLLRIEPYLTSDSQKNVLVNIIKGLRLYEQFDSPNGRKIFSIP